MKTENIVTYSLFAALICIFSCVSIPVGAVPITLSLMAVLMSALILGSKGGAISSLIYIVLGSFGLPVFSGFGGGFQILFGPTGGYIWSYVLVAYIAGFSKNISAKSLKFLIVFSAVTVCYFFGTLQFSFVQKMSFLSSLALCVYPFVIGDVIKVVAAVCVAEAVCKRLNFIKF